MRRPLASTLLLAVSALYAFAGTAGEGGSAVSSSAGERISAYSDGNQSQPGINLHFNENGEFKIVQFTDLHYNAHKAESRIVLKRMREVLSSEKPDLVVFTGDLVYSSPADKALDEIFAVVTECGARFCAVFGNHDPDFASREYLYDRLCSYPGCAMPVRAEGSAAPDYSISVMASDGNKRACVLYFIDSNAHLFEDGKFVGYDAVHPEQVEWYRRTSGEYRVANGGSPIPAVAFFHIPLPEFHNAVADENCPLIGTRMEYACAPAQNTGLFEAFVQCGDVMAVFVGHDHDNDYATVWQNILLAYGRYTGGNTEYNNLSNGARVIVLKEGRRSLDSWIVLKAGHIQDRITFPDSFLKSDWRHRPLDPECR